MSGPVGRNLFSLPRLGGEGGALATDEVRGCVHLSAQNPSASHLTPAPPRPAGRAIKERLTPHIRSFAANFCGENRFQEAYAYRGNGSPGTATPTAVVEGAVVDGGMGRCGHRPLRRVGARSEARSASGYRRFSPDYHTTCTQAARKSVDAIFTVHRPGSVARIYNSGLRGRRRLSIRQCPRGYGSTHWYRPPLREPTRQYTVETQSYRAPPGSKGHCPLVVFFPLLLSALWRNQRAESRFKSSPSGDILLPHFCSKSPLTGTPIPVKVKPTTCGFSGVNPVGGCFIMSTGCGPGGAFRCEAAFLEVF